MSDNIMERIAKSEAEEKEFRYKQAKEIIYELAEQTEGMEDFVQIARQGDYERKEKEKSNSRFMVVFLIGVPIVLLAYSTGMINWLVIAGLTGLGALSIVVNR